MNPIIILSDKIQLGIFNRLEQRAQITVFSDNEAFFPLLEEQGISFNRIDEFLLRDQWATINAWGCGKAAAWIKACEHLTPPGQLDVLPGFFLNLSNILISAVQNFKYAEHLLRTIQPTQVFVFEDPKTNGEFPFLTGNQLLNYFLKRLAQDRRIPVHVQALPVLKQPLSASLHSLRGKARHFLKLVAARFLTRFPDKKTQGHLLVYGSLIHLKPVMGYLQKKHVPIVLFDNEFHQELFRYAKDRGIFYLTADRLKVPSASIVREFAFRLEAQFKSKYEEAVRNGFFMLEGYDFAPCLREIVFWNMRSYFYSVSLEWFRCVDLLKSFSIAGCLVEEDFDMRANFCSIMKQHLIRNFCVSHAHAGFDFNVLPEHQGFGQSITFVNSEHEKLKMYGARGWDLSKIVVSGTPRYDRFSVLPLKHPSASPVKQILYCAGALSLYTPDILGYLGTNIYSYGAFQRKAFKALALAAEGLPVEIVIKPHYVGDFDLWCELAHEQGRLVPIKVLKHSEDFVTLLTGSDAMVLPHWSTSVIEAALSRIPTIYLDLYSEKSPSVLEFSAHGLCRYANSVPQLRLELERVVSGNACATVATDKTEFFLGKPSGRNAEIVAEFILKSLRSSHCKKETQVLIGETR